MTGLLLKRALDSAAIWHRDQKRKYPGVEVPYMSHLAGVAVILARHGFADEVVAAGALHDCIEDCGVAHEELARRFGARVADLVRSVSEPDKSLAWEERKHRYLEAFAAAEWESQAIALADKVDNFRSTMLCKRDHGDPWAMLKRGRAVQMEHFEALATLVRRLQPHPLVREFEDALEQVRGM